MPYLKYLITINGPALLNDFVYYDDYWDRRDEKIENVFQSHRNRVIAQSIPKGSGVLDIGCGTGAFLRYLQSQRPDIKALGVDVSQRAIEKDRRHGVRCQVIDAKVPLRVQLDDSFDYHKK